MTKTSDPKKINSILYVYLPVGEKVMIFPLGIAYLASYVHRLFPEMQQRILDLSLIDKRERWKVFKETLRQGHPDITAFSWRHLRYFGTGFYDEDLRGLRFNSGRTPMERLSFLFKGFSCWRSYSETFLGNINFIKWAHANMGQTRILVGGPGFSIFHRDISARLPAGVIGCLGEGEKALVDLIRLPEKVPHPDDRPFSVEKEIRAVDYEYTARIFPDHQRYEGQTIGVETNRGCGQHCVYCPPAARNRTKVEYRDPDEIIKEILGVKKVFSTHKIWFVDRLVLSDKGPENLSCLLRKLIDRAVNISWSGYMRPDIFTAELADLIVRSGLSHFIVPVTSGSQRIVDSLKLGFNVSSVLGGCRLLKEAGYRGSVDVELTLGILKESAADIENTFAVYKQIRDIFKPDLVKPVFNVCSVFPGSEFERDLINRGYLRPKYNPVSLNPIMIKKLFYVEKVFSRMMKHAYTHSYKACGKNAVNIGEGVLDHLYKCRGFVS